jgi:hypothetical protein
MTAWVHEQGISYGLVSLPTGVVLAALLFGIQAVAQANQPSMDVGTVALNLGMPRDKVLARIKQCGYKILELAPEGKEDVIAVTLRDITDTVQRAMVLVDNDGKLFFRNGVLVRIIREVSPSGIDTDRDLALSLFGMVQGLEKEGSNHLCSVNTTEEISEPGIEVKEILVTCSVGRGISRTSHIRWVTSEKLRDQFHVTVYQELWRNEG